MSKQRTLGQVADVPEPKKHENCMDNEGLFRYLSALHAALKRRFHELIVIMEQNNLEWRGDATISYLKSCIQLTDELFAKLASSKKLGKQIVDDLTLRKNTIISRITAEMPKKQESRPAEQLIPFSDAPKN